MTGNVTRDAWTDQKTSILLHFKAAYASESINAKAGNLIKNCRPILRLHGNFLNSHLFRDMNSYLLFQEENMYLDTASSAQYV